MYAAVARVDSSNIVLGFEKGRDTIAVKLNCALAGVITRKRQPDIATESIKQPSQISCSAEYVLARIEKVLHSEPGGSFGHKLHKAHRTLHRNSRAIERGLRSHDGKNKAGVQPVESGGFLNQRVYGGVPRGDVMSRENRRDFYLCGSLKRRCVGRLLFLELLSACSFLVLVGEGNWRSLRRRERTLLR